MHGLPTTIAVCKQATSLLQPLLVCPSAHHKQISQYHNLNACVYSMIMIDVHWNKSVGGLYSPGGTQGNWCLSLSCDVQNGDALTLHWPWVKLLPREKPKLISSTRDAKLLERPIYFICMVYSRLIGTRQTQHSLRRYHGLGYIFRKHPVAHYLNQKYNMYNYIDDICIYTMWGFMLLHLSFQQDVSDSWTVILGNHKGGTESTTIGQTTIQHRWPCHYVVEMHGACFVLSNSSKCMHGVRQH